MDWNFSQYMTCRLVFRLEVKFVWVPWKMSYTFKATGILWQNVLLFQWQSVHRSPSIVWVLDFFLKANNSPGLQTWTVGWWMCIQCLIGVLHGVSGCMCAGLFCFVVVLPVIAVEVVVVLKEVTGCAVFCINVLVVLCGPVWNIFDSICIESKWHFSWYCFSYRSCRIWNTFDADVPLDVLILKLGTFSPLTTFSSG